MPTTRSRLGWASNSTSFGASRRAVACVPNQIGFGQARKGARMTVFSDRENMSVLCTTSVPEPMSCLTCPGKAEWRKSAEQWQLDLSKHGRVAEDQPGELVVISECEEMGRRLLAEWLAAHPDLAVEEPPRVENANYSLSPGFPESGKRMTWRLVKS